MGKLCKFLKSQDAFGSAVALNYDGEATYKTGLGALMTIAIKTFLLVFAATQTLALFGCKDPVISQVSILNALSTASIKVTRIISARI